VYGVAACAIAALAIDAAAQGRRVGATIVQVAPQPSGRVLVVPVQVDAGVADDPFSGPVVTNAPFSADAITTVTQVLGDGTRLEQRTTARFYRDSAGRVRREQTILGLDVLNPSREARTVITIDPDPGDESAYTLDPTNRTARRVPRAVESYWGGVVNWLGASNLGAYVITRDGLSLGLTVNRTRRRDVVPQGVSQPEESLGTRQIEGVTAVGRRTINTIPLGQIGNDRPIVITDERWESPDLQLLVRSLHHDPRTGDVEYRLTNINRAEPSPDLFVIPSDYTVPDAGAAGARTGGAPGQRTGGPGPRSGGGGR
jgi:hypothetical protein